MAIAMNIEIDDLGLKEHKMCNALPRNNKAREFGVSRSFQPAQLEGNIKTRKADSHILVDKLLEIEERVISHKI